MVEPVSLARPWRDNAISGCVTGMPLVNSTDCIWECAELRERSGDGQMVTVELQCTTSVSVYYKMKKAYQCSLKCGTLGGRCGYIVERELSTTYVNPSSR